MKCRDIFIENVRNTMVKFILSSISNTFTHCRNILGPSKTEEKKKNKE